MLLNHYTSADCLRGISYHGLTVGNVPTDIQSHRGRLGIWLTSSDAVIVKGREGFSSAKLRYRLVVNVPDTTPLLHKWIDWSVGNVTAKTIDILHKAAEAQGSSDPRTWHVFFGVIEPADIVSCVDTMTNLPVPNWGEICSPELDTPGVPAFQRDAWHRQILKLNHSKRA